MVCDSSRNDILKRIGAFAARDYIDGAERLSELFPDWSDAIDLLENLEETHRVNLRAFLENGQPEVGSGPWRYKVARDATAAEIADHIEQGLLASR